MRDTAVTSRGSETDSRSSVVPSFDSYAEGRSFRNANRVVTLSGPRVSLGNTKRRAGSPSKVVGPEASPGNDGCHHQQDAVACDLQVLFAPDVGERGPDHRPDQAQGR